MRYEGYNATVENEAKTTLKVSASLQMTVSHCRMKTVSFGNAIISQGLLLDSKLISDLESNHWLKATNPPGEALQQVQTWSNVT